MHRILSSETVLIVICQCYSIMDMQVPPVAKQVEIVNKRNSFSDISSSLNCLNLLRKTIEIRTPKRTQNPGGVTLEFFWDHACSKNR